MRYSSGYSKRDNFYKTKRVNLHGLKQDVTLFLCEGCDYVIPLNKDDSTVSVALRK